MQKTHREIVQEQWQKCCPFGIVEIIVTTEQGIKEQETALLSQDTNLRNLKAKNLAYAVTQTKSL